MIRRLVLVALAIAVLATLLVPITAETSSAAGLSPDAVTTVPSDTATGAISALQSKATSQFPKRLIFNLQAKSNAQISSIRIAYRVGDDPVTSVARVSFAPANRVDATYQIDLGQELYPPGVTIQYRWQIEDQTGAKLTTDWSELKVTDPRFFWHDRTVGPITLHWYDGGDQFADAMLTAASKALATASAAVKATTIKPVQIYLYANQDDFRSVLGSGADAWVGGQTYPLYRVIVLLAPSSDVVDAQRSIAHEMTHVAVDSTSEDLFGPLPSWLGEGMAMVAEGPLDPVFRQALDAAVRSHHLLSIQAISGNFPESTEGATLAYAESQSIVDFFTRSYGRDRLARLITAFHQGATSDEAFQQTIGMSTAEFQRAWEASLQRQANAPSATPAPQQSRPSLIGVLLTPITFVVAVVRSVLQLLQATKG